MARFLSPQWKQSAILLLLISAAPSLTVSAQDSQHADGPSGSADPGRQSAPDAASGPSVTICDPGTFANCHKVQGVVPPKLTHSRDPEYPGRPGNFTLAAFRSFNSSSTSKECREI
jgi:hypothetical protein